MDDRFQYKSLTDADWALFNKYKNSIETEVRKKYPSVPATFELKPVRVRNLEACGTIHDFKIALPDNTFVKISFLTGAAMMRAPGQPAPEHPPEPKISVSDTVTATVDAE